MEAADSTPVYWGGLGGYKVFRIPVLVRAGQSLLAFAEGRPHLRDHGSIDIVLRRSPDGGRTWGPVELALNGAAIGSRRGTTVGNPTPIYLPKRRELLMLFCSNSGRADERAIRRGGVGPRAGRRVWVSRSANLGANWSAPTEITAQVKQPDWTWYAVGPGGALRLRNGTLVVPATHASQATREKPGAFDHSHVLASHDLGGTWHAGAPAAPGTNEATVAELSAGGAGSALLLNSRSLLKPGGRRSLQLSPDGGASWSEPWAGTAEPTNPIWSPSGCHGSMLSTRRGGSLYFSGPRHEGKHRRNVTVSRSEDGGKSWPAALVLHDGPSGYSSLARLPGGGAAGTGPALGVLFERGVSHYAEQIAFARVRLTNALHGRSV